MIFQYLLLTTRESHEIMQWSPELERAMEKTEHTTICVTKDTKERLDKEKAPGQSYNGFICQLIQRWEEAHDNRVFSGALQRAE